MTTKNKIKYSAKVERELRKLNPGEEAYCSPLLTRFQQLLSQDRVAAAKQLLATYPMPTATLLAARAALVALTEPK